MYLIPIGYLKQFELESSFPITILQLFIFLCILNGTLPMIVYTIKEYFYLFMNVCIFI
jgi:hypothetical protein